MAPVAVEVVFSVVMFMAAAAGAVVTAVPAVFRVHFLMHLIRAQHQGVKRRSE